MSKMLLRVLSDAEIETLHEKTLEVLETVGAKVAHDEALARLSRAGARGVDLTESKLAVDSPRGAGPGGSFLTDPLTLDLLRSEEFFGSPYLDLTGGYSPGAPGMAEIAHQTVQRMLHDSRPTVPEKVQDAVRGFFRNRYHDPAVADGRP